MCGFAGIIPLEGKRISQSMLEAVSKSLIERGPDGAGELLLNAGRFEVPNRAMSEWTCELALTHRRLAIIDLSDRATQPMRSRDGKYAVVFNGEIYNYKELRVELEQRGVEFTTSSDTEVLLQAYVHWGEQVVRKLVGMFAFAIVDILNQEVFCARDFVGIKPLYYVRTNEYVAFGSSIRALLPVLGSSRAANPTPILHYMIYGLTDGGEDTCVAGIKRFPPATFRRFHLRDKAWSSPNRYWTFNPQAVGPLSFQTAVKKWRELFLKNVELHLRSDVPIGAALSGGLDSSAIVAAVRYLVGKKQEVHAFSFIAHDPKISEEKWVDILVDHSHAIGHKVHSTSSELVRDLDRLIESQEEPFGSTSLYAQYRVFQAASERGIKVMLDGQGGDELLAGYPDYLLGRVAGALKRFHFLEAWNVLGSRRAFSKLSFLGRACLSQLTGRKCKEWLREVQVLHGNQMPWLRMDWFWDRNVDIRFPEGPPSVSGRPLLEQMLRSLGGVGLPGLLRYEDKNSMAFSVESRVPFLTQELVEYSLSLPDEYLLDNDGTSKRVFRAAMRGIVPDVILDRQDKVGFATPERDWLVHARSWVDQLLNSDVFHAIPFFRHEAVLQDWKRIQEGRAPFDRKAWRWVNFTRWSDIFSIQYTS